MPRYEDIPIPVLIRALRHLHRWTYDTLAVELGEAPATVCAWENGEVLPSWDGALLIVQLARAYEPDNTCP